MGAGVDRGVGEVEREAITSRSDDELQPRAQRRETRLYGELSVGGSPRSMRESADTPATGTP